ncbi:hypothetical protein CSB37_00165 [bacterium DOLZORAL124_38_8]|nr:MAG: hypothetical protein CSB37_00165 [bacterium DOLZORAL124_38_8]
MKVLILAGGFATRLWPLSETHAKPLLLINGKSILAHLYDKIPAEYEVILLTNKKFEAQFADEIKKINRTHNTTIFCEDAHSDGEKLGALGAISLACEQFHINENLFILAGDNILPDLDLEKLACKEHEGKIVVRTVPNKHEARKFGVIEPAQNWQENPFNFEVATFEEKPNEPKSTMVSTGFMCLGKDNIPVLQAYAKKSPDALGGIFMELLHQKIPVKATTVSGDWFDIGSFTTYLEAHEKLQTEPVLCDQNTYQQNNKLSGKVFIGENCVIENCRLHNTIIYPNTKLKNCIISQSVIDEHCELDGLDLNQKFIRQQTKLINENPQTI